MMKALLALLAGVFISSAAHAKDIVVTDVSQGYRTDQIEILPGNQKSAFMMGRQWNFVVEARLLDPSLEVQARGNATLTRSLNRLHIVVVSNQPDTRFTLVSYSKEHRTFTNEYEIHFGQELTGTGADLELKAGPKGMSYRQSNLGNFSAVALAVEGDYTANWFSKTFWVRSTALVTTSTLSSDATKSKITNIHVQAFGAWRGDPAAAWSFGLGPSLSYDYLTGSPTAFGYKGFPYPGLDLQYLNHLSRAVDLLLIANYGILFQGKKLSPGYNDVRAEAVFTIRSCISEISCIVGGEYSSLNFESASSATVRVDSWALKAGLGF